MKKIITGFLVVSFFSTPLAFGAEAAAKYDKYGKPVGGTNTSINPPVTGTGPVAEGNSLKTSVSVDPLPCRDFENRGAVVLPARRGDDYICDPGYECRGVIGGFQCGWRNLTKLSANDPLCKFDSCSEMLLRQGLEDIKR